MTEQQPPTIRDYMDAWARAAEQLHPAWARITKAARPLIDLAQSPQGQALIAAAEARREREREQGCHCLCVKNHPGRHICHGFVLEQDLRHLAYDTPSLGRVDVPMCPPCSVATLAGAAR